MSYPPLSLMFLSNHVDPRDHSSCALTYDEVEHWLRATWRGYADPLEALNGAEAYLAPCRPRAFDLAAQR